MTRQHPNKISKSADPVSAEAAAVVAALRANEAACDKAFDALIPAAARNVTRSHWTSVEVARRAAALLADKPGTKVLDLGSGVGKFCIVGALTTDGSYTGVELRGGLVTLAQGIARRHKINNVKFITGDFLELDWAAWDAYYLFNPFASNLSETPRGFRAHSVPESGLTQFAHRCHARLAAVPPGRRAVVYWGYGLPMPNGWRLIQREMIRGEGLELWVKEWP